jgi:hypothetical protein
MAMRPLNDDLRRLFIGVGAIGVVWVVVVMMRIVGWL